MEGDSEEEILQALQNEKLDLADVYPENAHYYHQGLKERKAQKFNLSEEEIQECIREMNAKAEMDRLGKGLT